jgi:Domain of unknown function (DUF5615)
LAGFLLDVHVPLRVVAALRRLAPDCEIEHVARWRGGVLRTAADEDILTAAAGAGLLLVTFDLSTVRLLVDRWVAAGRVFPGVVFIVGMGVDPADIGAIARGLARAYAELGLLDPAYPVVYLQAP